MHISENTSLRAHNSFGFDVQAEYFCQANSVAEIQEALSWQQQHNKPLLILGGGSNTVFTRNVEGLVLQVAMDKLTSKATDDSFKVYAEAGVNWHQLVENTVFSNQYGLENLALIPGNAGAAPIQNIGAYGKELCDNLLSVDVIHRETGEASTISKQDCDFGYRHSVFKTPEGAAFIVVGIQLQLTQQDQPVISYQALNDALQDTPAGARDVFAKVCQLRNAKLPDPKALGNAGSFFKNPVIPCQQVDSLKKQFPNLPVYPHSDDLRKVPAAWLIDQAGWKGHKSGDVGVHNKQALVLVNYGNGNGQQIATLADEIQTDIKARFHISLEREPTIY